MCNDRLERTLTSSSGKRRIGFLAFSILLSIVTLTAILLLWACTSFGIGLTEDSFDYITAAESILQGKGIGRTTGLGEFRPMTHFPPLYPLALAGLNIVGEDLYDTARLLNALMFGLMVLFAGLIVWACTGSAGFSLFAAMLALSSETLLDISTWALTEPLYLALGSLSLVLLAIYLHDPRRKLLLLPASLTIGLAPLTRYVGLTLIAAGAMAMLFSLPRNWPTRWRAVFLFLVISGAPFIAWAGRNLKLTGSLIDRAVPAWHPPSMTQMEAGARTILGWVLPDIAVGSLKGAALLAGLGMVALTACAAVYWLAAISDRDRGRFGQMSRSLILLQAVYTAAYLVALLATVTGLDRRTPLDNRLLAPLHYQGIVLLVCVAAVLWKLGGLRLRILLLVLAAAFSILQVRRGVATVQVLREDARGFASIEWRRSAIIDYIRTLPAVPIYSNEIQPIYFQTGRLASFVPTRYNPATDADRADYEQWLDQMRQRLADQDGALILFGSEPYGFEPSEYRALTEGLTPVRRFNDGEVYVYLPPD